MNWHQPQQPPKCAICGWPLDQTAVQNPHGWVHRQCVYPHNPANMWPTAAIVFFICVVVAAVLNGLR